MMDAKTARDSRSVPQFGKPAGTALALLLLFILLALVASPVLAQDTTEITDDQVNAVAKDMYCPVCENEPLDACRTPACVQWKEEIRVMLANGATEQDIVDDFVARFGERVVGTPQDPFLRALSLVTPYVLAIAALLVGVWTLTRWLGHNRPAGQAATPADSPALSDDDYRARIEQDVRTSR